MRLAAFATAGHLVVVSAGTGHGKVDELLQRSGVERTVRSAVPHGFGAGHILQRSDLVATVPGVFWHAKCHRSPAQAG